MYHAGKPSRITGVPGWKATAESFVAWNFSALTYGLCFHCCDQPCSGGVSPAVVCPLSFAVCPHTYFLFSESTLCLHFLPCGYKIISLTSFSAAVVCLSDQALLPSALLSAASIAPFNEFRKGGPQDLQTGLVKPSLLDGYGKLQVLKVRVCSILMSTLLAPYFRGFSHAKRDLSMRCAAVFRWGQQG